MIPEELKKVKRVNHKTIGLPDDNNHDPSNIIFSNGRYYIWYTQHMGNRPYDHFEDCKIMMTSSSDGIHWEPGKDALFPSVSGWDNGGVLTANVFSADSHYYMWYVGVPRGYSRDGLQLKKCGLATSDSPEGIFKRIFSLPSLVPGDTGAWNDNGVDDVSSLYWKEKWYIYFKGTSAKMMEGDYTQIGLCTSSNITGPYEFYPRNPLIRGHAFSIWPYKNGVLLLSGLKDKKDEGYIYKDDWHDPKGHQYLYFSEDGISFIPCAEFPNRATGIFIPQGNAANDIRNYWGVSVNTLDRHYRRFIERFDFKVVE